MPLEIIFGINASGKDAIAKELKKRDNSIQITSESKLLMYHLGYIDSYDSQDHIDISAYKNLENTSQDRILETTRTVYKRTLENFKKSEIKYFLLSHLVFALTLDKGKTIYLDKREVPEWYREVGDKFIQVICNPEEILKRRIKDKSNGVRDRGNIDSCDEIAKHQSLCDIKWEKFTCELPKNKYLTVVNDDLEVAIDIVNNFIFK